MIMLRSAPSSDSSSQRTLITPYRSGGGTSEEEEELALLQHLEQGGQYQELPHHQAGPQPPQQQLPQQQQPDGRGAPRWDEHPQAGAWTLESASTAAPGGPQPGGPLPAEDDPPQGQAPVWQPGYPEENAGEGNEGGDTHAPFPAHGSQEAAPGRQPGPPGGPWPQDPVHGSEGNVSRLGRPAAMRPGLARHQDGHTSLVSDRSTRLAQQQQQRPAPRPATPTSQLPAPAPPPSPGQGLPPAGGPGSGTPKGLEAAPLTASEGSKHAARLGKIWRDGKQVELLQLQPPQSLADVEALRREEIRTSPTSAAQARALEVLAEMMDYKLKWELNPDKESTASNYKIDEPGREITFIISQKRLGGGTFGHESEHAIKHLLREMHFAEQPGIRTAERMREIDRLTTDPVYAYPVRQKPGPGPGPGPVPKDAKADPEDNPVDVIETVPLRIGNVITSERILNLLAERNQLDHGQRLDRLDELYQRWPEGVRGIEVFEESFLTAHPGLSTAFPVGTEIGRNQLERLREDWRKKAGRAGAPKP